MMIKKEDHNTGASDDFKKFLMEKLIKNLTNGALSRNLIKSIEKYFFKNIRFFMSKKVHYQKKKKTFSKG